MVLRAHDRQPAEPGDREPAVRLAVDEIHPQPRAERLHGAAVVRLLERDDVGILRAQHTLDRVETPSPPFQMFHVRTRTRPGARYCSRGRSSGGFGPPPLPRSRSRRKRVSSAASVSPETSWAAISSVRCSSSST